MASVDLHNKIQERNALNFQTIASDTTTAGVIIDTLSFESVEFILKTGAVTAGDVTALIEDGDDAGLSDAAAVADQFLLGTEAATILNAANGNSRIGYNGKKRYVRLSAVTDNSANLEVGAIAVLGAPLDAPTS